MAKIQISSHTICPNLYIKLVLQEKLLPLQQWKGKRDLAVVGLRKITSSMQMKCNCKWLILRLQLLIKIPSPCSWKNLRNSKISVDSLGSKLFNSMNVLVGWTESKLVSVQKSLFSRKSLIFKDLSLWSMFSYSYTCILVANK